MTMSEERAKGEREARGRNEFSRSVFAQRVYGTLPLRRMAARLAVFGLILLVCSPEDGLLGATAVAQQLGHQRSPAVDKFSVVTQEWHRYPGLAVADITFNNGNDYVVRHAVVSCDFLGLTGSVIATRGSTIFQSFPPGQKKIDGVHFSLREKKNVTPGSCRVLSVRTVGAPN
jgi:hypothetical protein